MQPWPCLLRWTHDTHRNTSGKSVQNTRETREGESANRSTQRRYNTLSRETPATDSPAIPTPHTKGLFNNTGSLGRIQLVWVLAGGRNARIILICALKMVAANSFQNPTNCYTIKKERRIASQQETCSNLLWHSRRQYLGLSRTRYPFDYKNQNWY